MSVYVCSLISNEQQVIPADGGYHLLRFPYGGAESYDGWGMHTAEQPDGEVSVFADERSGLIWPAVDGWGSLTAMVHWESGNYSEVRSQFVRDPLGLASGLDTTCTEDDAANAGGQYRAKHHELFVHPGTPLGIRVRHNGSSAATVFHAQFKLAIHTDVATPSAPGGV